MPWLLLIPLLVTGTGYKYGAGSHYAPGDGNNAGELACGGRFTSSQKHVAMRRWRRVGCGRLVLVHAEQTGRWALAPVRDGGPYGMVSSDGRGYRVYTGHTPPVGWRWRGVADLSVGLWQDLGRPRFLSPLHIILLPRWLTYARKIFKTMAASVSPETARLM